MQNLITSILVDDGGYKRVYKLTHGNGISFAVANQIATITSNDGQIVHNNLSGVHQDVNTTATPELQGLILPHISVPSTPSSGKVKYFAASGIDMGGKISGTVSGLFMIDSGGVIYPVAGDPEGWHEIGDSGEPTFLSGWINYGGSNFICGFRKIDNQVFIRGVIKSGTVGQAVFTLPIGYRPPSVQRVPCVSGDAYAQINVTTTGDVKVQVGNNSWVDIGRISFYLS